MKRFSSFIKEDPSQKHLDHFLDHAKGELGLESLPKINLVNNKEIAIQNRSFGGYSPGLKEINVNTAGRHPADVYRTLAHELVHYKQDLDGRLTVDAGETGSTFENEANTLAGVIMRNYGRSNPKIYEDYENPYRFDWGTPEGTKYMMKMHPWSVISSKTAKEVTKKKHINELGMSVNYQRPIGAMELVKFHKIASKTDKEQLKRHLNNKEHDKALKLVGKVTKTKLV